MSKASIVKMPCHKCGHSTQQTVVFKEDELDVQEIFFEKLKGEPRYIVIARSWKIAKCNGCGSINAKVEIRHRANKVTEVFTFPKTKADYCEPWIFGLDVKYIEIFSEIFNAISHESYTLATMGMRLVLDMFMDEKIGNSGTFKERLGKLKKKGFVSDSQIDLCNSIIETGNAASHRGYRPNLEQTKKLLSIVKSIMKIEVLKGDAADLLKKVPSRKGKRESGGGVRW